MMEEQRNHFSTLLMLCLIAVVGVFTLDVYLPGMPSMAEQFSVSLKAIAYTFTGFSVVFAITQLFHGLISDTVGRKPVLIGGLFIAAIATLICSYADNYCYLFAARLLQALGISSFVVVNAIIRDLYIGVRAVQARTMVATASGVSISIAPSIGGLLQDSFSWQGGFYASFALITIALLYVSLFFKESFRPSVQMNQAEQIKLNPLRSYLSLFNDNQYMRYVCIATLSYSVHFTFIIMSSNIFMHKIGLSSAIFGFWMIVYGGMYFVSGLFAGWIAKKVSLLSLIVVGTVLIGFGGGLMLLIPGFGVWQVLLPMGIVTMGVTMVRALAITGALAPLPARAGQCAAGLNLVQFAVSAMIATIVNEINAQPEMLLGCLAISAAIIISYLRWRIINCENINNNACLV